MRILTLLVLVSHAALAQLQLPEISPDEQIIQRSGYSTIEIRYGRPLARGRKIMGALVPFDRLWRTGSGKCTTISFDTPVKINSTNVPAGIYALLTVPGEKEWTVMLNTDTSKVYGAPEEYEVKNETVRFKVVPKKTDRYYESLTISSDIKKYDAVIFLAWENTTISFEVQTGSHEKAKAHILEQVSLHPRDTDILANAAYYYSMNNEDSSQVLKWLNQALAIREDRWLYHQKIDLLEKMKDYAEARKTAVSAIAFLKKMTPDGDGWIHSVNGIEAQMKRWPSR